MITVTIKENERLAERFYAERDKRTAKYLENDKVEHLQKPVSLHVSADACEKRSGQLLVVTLANLLPRIHRNLRFNLSVPDTKLLVSPICGGSTLSEEIERLVRRVDPCGLFALGDQNAPTAEVSIGIGARSQPGLTFYLGCDLSNAMLSHTPCPLGVKDSSADLRGAGLAAVLGSVAALKYALDAIFAETIMSAWNFRCGTAADPGPDEFPNIDVGNGLMIGAGAVASAVGYWLMQWGDDSSWTIVDKDKVELHNTNRGMLMFPEDAGWPDSKTNSPRSKVECLGGHLPGSILDGCWYDTSEHTESQFDTVLVLANERNVRSLAAHRNDPIQLQSTTGSQWFCELHRHIARRDDCIKCRMDFDEAPTHVERKTHCSKGIVKTNDGTVRQDAALPFLSAASGLMLASSLQHLQSGDYVGDDTHHWIWDFYTEKARSDSYKNYCKTNCKITRSAKFIRTRAQNTRWSGKKWLPE